METESTPIIPRVAAAFRACGRRNAGTPFEMASTPVSAVDPDENAWRITKRLAPAAAPARMWSAGTTAWGQPPAAHLTRAVITKAKIERMNPYVGTAKTVPDSRTPRRFAKVIRTTNPIERNTLCWWRLGTAEVMAKTPATTDTETVRT